MMRVNNKNNSPSFRFIIFGLKMIGCRNKNVRESGVNRTDRMICCSEGSGLDTLVLLEYILVNLS